MPSYFCYNPDSQVVNVENTVPCSQNAKNAKNAKVGFQKNASFCKTQTAYKTNNDITSSSLEKKEEKSAFSEINALRSLCSLRLETLYSLYEDAIRATLTFLGKLLCNGGGGA